MKVNHYVRGLAHLLATSILAVLAALLLYMLVIGGWQERWGATGAEVSQAFPGDELVAQSQNQTTRAITINAPLQTSGPGWCRWDRAAVAFTAMKRSKT